MTTFNTRVSFDHVRNTASGFTSANPVLGYGVIGLETDSGKIKVGDGATAWATLPYSGGGPVEWSAITGKPSTFAPATHTHAKGEVGLGSVDNTADAAKPVSTAQAAADSAVASAAATDATTKANAAQAAAVQRANHTGTQAISTVSGLQTALDAKATPADVSSAVAALVNSSPAALDTLGELATALGNDANFASTVTNALAGKATAVHTHVAANVTDFSTAAAAAAPVQSVAGKTGTVSLAKGDVGLGNVDNTADAAKPVSTAQAAADSAVASAAASDATTKANAAQAAAVQRANHTGTQTASTISDFTTAVQAAAPATTNASLLTSGTLADARLSSTVTTALTNQRAPTDGSVTDAKIDAAGLSGGVINWSAIAEWAPSTAYAKGALVSYLGVGYRRSLAGTSGTTFSTANWTQITPSVNVVATATTLSASQNDYALPAAADIVRLSSSAAVTITGVVAGAGGQAELLINVGAFAITLSHQSTSSTAANRLIVPWAGNYVLDANGGAALLVYDATDSRWRVV